MIVQLSPTIPFDTPKGPSLALFLIEAGDEHDLQWVCAVQSGPHVNEIWTWRNRDVRARANVTMGRIPDVPKAGYVLKETDVPLRPRKHWPNDEPTSFQTRCVQGKCQHDWVCRAAEYCIPEGAVRPCITGRPCASQECLRGGLGCMMKARAPVQHVSV